MRRCQVARTRGVSLSTFHRLFLWASKYIEMSIIPRLGSSTFSSDVIKGTNDRGHFHNLLFTVTFIIFSTRHSLFFLDHMNAFYFHILTSALCEGAMAISCCNIWCISAQWKLKNKGCILDLFPSLCVGMSGGVCADTHGNECGIYRHMV